MAKCGKIEEIKTSGRKLLCHLYASIYLKDARSSKRSSAKEVTEAVVRNTGAPQSAVHVIINDMPEGTLLPTRGNAQQIS